MQLNYCKNIVILFLLSFLSFGTFAADFYVSITGNDTSGDGSVANPWLTVGKAFKAVPKNAGNTIHIGTGTFNETSTLTAPSGTTIVGDGVSKTVIASAMNTVFYINNAKEVTIQDFALDGKNLSMDILHIENSSNIKVFRIDLRNGEGTGFNAAHVKNILVDGGVYNESGGRGNNGGDKSVVEWQFISNGVFQNITINDQKAEAWRGYGDMIGVIITKCTFNGCQTSAWNNGLSGNISVEWWGVTNVTNCEIFYCSLNGTMSLAGGVGNGNKSLRAHHNIITGNYGIEMHTDNLEIDHNFFHDCGYPFANFGGPQDKLVNHSVHHNVCYNTGFSQFMHYSTSINNLKAYNNMVYRSNGGGGFNYFGGEVVNNEFANNILINTAKSPFQTYNIPTHHNLFQFTPSVGTDFVVGGPLFVKKNSTDVSGFTIQAGSPAIDKGILISGITDNVTDGKPDIGAYEFGETWTVGPISPDAKAIQSFVSISSPKVDQMFSLPAKITISADAMSLDSITKVEFYAGDTKIGEDNSAPYSVVWNVTEKGNYQLTAVLIDNKGNQTKSAPVDISVSGITVKITSPVSGAKFVAPTNISLEATASVVSGSIAKVEFYSGTEKLGERKTAPYTFNWSNVQAGTYILKAVAWDDLNLSRESSTVNITVSNSVELPRTVTPPVMDGVKDALYSGSNDSIKLITMGTVPTLKDLSAYWTSVYDNDYLYLFVNVTDDKLVNDSPEFYNDDCVEVFIDADNSKGSSYGANDFAFWFEWNNPVPGEEKHKATAGVEFKMVKTTAGYNLEAKIPWTTLGEKPIGNLIGIEIQMDDDDDGGTRDTETNWNTSTSDAWQYPFLFGTARLSDKTTSAIQFNDNQADFRIFPNPTKGQITIETIFDAGSSYEISDMTGNIIHQWKTSGNVEHFDFSKQKGIYFIRLVNGKTSQVEKVIVN